MIKRLGLLLGLVLLVGGLAILVVSQIAVSPTPSEVPPLGEKEERFQFTTVDGVQIEASFFPAQSDGSDVILLLHGNGASRSQFASHVGWLNEAGYAVMAIDFRGHGESQSENKSFGLREGRDAAAAVDWIRMNHRDAGIGVIGVSLGGAAALLGDGSPIDVDAIVLKAVYPDFDRAVRNRVAVHTGAAFAGFLTPLLTFQTRLRYGVAPSHISPVSAAANFKGSVLVIGGESDLYTPTDESRELSNAFPGRHWLWMVANLGHAQVSDLDDEVYRSRILTFFGEELSGS